MSSWENALSSSDDEHKYTQQQHGSHRVAAQHHHHQHHDALLSSDDEFEQTRRDTASDARRHEPLSPLSHHHRTSASAEDTSSARGRQEAQSQPQSPPSHQRASASASSSSSAASAAARVAKIDELAFSDSHHFTPRPSQNVSTRREDARARATPGAFSEPQRAADRAAAAASAAGQPVRTPKGKHVDGELTAVQARALEKSEAAAFLAAQTEAARAASGYPAPASSLDALAASLVPAARPPQKVPFYSGPLEKAYGTSWTFAREHAPPSPGRIGLDDALAKTVEFMPISTGFVAHKPSSVWRKRELDREGMRAESNRNALGTAPEVLYTTWRKVNAKTGKIDAPPPLFPQPRASGGNATGKLASAGPASPSAKHPAPSAPLYKQRLGNNTVLLTSAPPRTGSLVPPSPPSAPALKHNFDPAPERQAMALQDWNVLTAHDTSILNPFDAKHRAKRDAAQARARLLEKGLYAGMNPQARQRRLETDRRSMAENDLNALGAPRPSNYRIYAQQGLGAPRLYVTNLGPLAFANGGAAAGAGRRGGARGAGAGALILSEYPLAPAAAATGWGALDPDPKAAWSLHKSNLARERAAMRGENVNALTGARYVEPEGEWAAAKRKRTKSARETAAMAKQDVNVLSSGMGPHNHIGSGAAIFKYETLRGQRFALPKTAPRALTKPNRHSATAHPQGLRYYKRSHGVMSGAVVLHADQSSNVLDAASGSAELSAQASYASSGLLAHGQAYSQRTRQKYRYVDWGGGWDGVSTLPLLAPLKPGAKPSPAALQPASFVPTPIAAPTLSKHGVLLKKHTTAHARAMEVAARKLGSRGVGKGSQTDPTRLGTNTNTPWTLIPRFNEPDAASGTQSATTAGLGVVVTSTGAIAVGPGSFDFDTSKPFCFGRAVASDRWAEFRASYGDQQRRDLEAWPYLSRGKRLFRLDPRQSQRAKQLAREHARIKHLRAQEAGELPQPAAHIKLLSRRREAIEAEVARMDELHRNTFPWGAGTGAPFGLAFGQPFALAGAEKGLFGAFAQASQTGLLYQPKTTGAFGTMPVSSSAGPYGGKLAGAGMNSTGSWQPNPFTVKYPDPAPGAFGPAAPPPKLPASFAPSVAPAPSSSLPREPAFVSPGAEETLAALEESLAASLKINPFQSPEQLEQIEALAKRQAEAEEVLRAQKASERAERKAKQKAATAAAANLRKRGVPEDPSGAFSAITAPQFGAMGTKGEVAFAAPPARFSPDGAGSSPSGSLGIGAGVNAWAPQPPAVEFKSPIFGSSLNPYSQAEAFEKWQRWNARHGVGAAKSRRPKKPLKYEFKPQPFRADGLDTSDEDSSSDDEKDNDPFYPKSSFARSASPASKRKMNETAPLAVTRDSPFEIGLDSSRRISLTPFGTAPIAAAAAAPFSPLHARSASPARGGRARSRSRGRSRSRSRSASPLSGSGSYGFARPADQESRRRDRVRQENRERERSLSPFSFHAQPRNDATLASSTPAVESLYPAHRSSVQFHRSSDAPFTQANDVLDAFGHGSAAREMQWRESHGSTADATALRNQIAAESSPFGSFTTGFDRSTGSGSFASFNAAFSVVHSNAGSYPAPNTLSPSPSKRLKALRRDRGSKREAGDERDPFDFGPTAGRLRDAEELEWEAQGSREQQWRREQEALRARDAYLSRTQQDLAYRTQDRALYAPQTQAQQQQMPAGVTVNIHGGTATATIDRPSRSAAKPTKSGKHQSHRSDLSSRHSRSSAAASTHDEHPPIDEVGGAEDAELSEAEEDAEDQEAADEFGGPASSLAVQPSHVASPARSHAAFSSKSGPVSSAASHRGSSSKHSSSRSRLEPNPVASPPSKVASVAASKAASVAASKAPSHLTSKLASPRVSEPQSKVPSPPVSSSVSRPASAVASKTPSAQISSPASHVASPRVSEPGSKAASRPASAASARALAASAVPSKGASVAASVVASARQSAAPSARPSVPASARPSAPGSARSSLPNSARSSAPRTPPPAAAGAVSGSRTRTPQLRNEEEEESKYAQPDLDEAADAGCAEHLSPPSTAESFVACSMAEVRGDEFPRDPAHAFETAAEAEASLAAGAAAADLDSSSIIDEFMASHHAQTQQQRPHSRGSTRPSSRGRIVGADASLVDSQSSHTSSGASLASLPALPASSVFGWKDPTLHTDMLAPALKPKPKLTSDSRSPNRSPSKGSPPPAKSARR